MQRFCAGLLLFAGLASAACEIIDPAVALVDVDEDEELLLEQGVIEPSDLLEAKKDEVTLLPEPLAVTNKEADKPPGEWTDEQKLTLETFKEIVAADVENVWVIAYIDPRCEDCLILSVEWEKLTQIEEREKRKIKLGYVDISVEENWKIIQDHTKGKKLSQTPEVALYGENKESPHFYPRDQPSAKGVHTWVSSYADHFGYGYWRPEQYKGTDVKSEATDKAKSLSEYGSHGKYKIGKQVTQLRVNKQDTVARRRTVVAGGKLSGIAHDAPEDKIYYQKVGKGYTGHGYGGSQRQIYYDHSGRVVRIKKDRYGRPTQPVDRYGRHIQVYDRYKRPIDLRNHHSVGYGGNYGYGKGTDRFGRPSGAAKKEGTLGTYGNPYRAYYGPGITKNTYKALNGRKIIGGKGAVVYDEKLGKGIVLGKFTRNGGQTYKLVDYDKKDLAGPDSKAYKQALALARASGKGSSDIIYEMPDSKAALNPEDIPDTSMVHQDITVPTVKEATEISKEGY